MLFTYSHTDSSWFRISDSTVVHNAFGVVGANVSDILFSIFGASSWWLVIGLFYLGYHKIIRKKIDTGSWYNILQLVSFVVLVVDSAALEYASLFSVASEFHNGYGGMVGKFIFNLFFIKFGIVPTTIVVINNFFCFVFHVSLVFLY